MKYGADAEALTLVSEQTVLEIEIESSVKIYVAVQAADQAEATIGFEAEAAEALGTSGNPIVLEPFAGDHICDYAGSDVWYAITATENGYVTLSSSFATAKLGGGESMYSISYNDSETYGTIRFFAAAGSTTYVVIGDWAEGESAEIAFSMTFEAGEHELDGSYEYPFTVDTVPGDYTCAYGGSGDYIWYEVSVSETGYLTVSSTNAAVELVISSMTNAWTEDAVSGNGSVKYAMSAGTCYIGIMGSSAADIPFSVSFEAGELEPDGSAKLPYTAVAGENVCAFPGGYNPVWYQITVEEACTITVSAIPFVSATHNSWSHNTESCVWIVVSPVADVYDMGAVSNQSSVGSDVVFEADAAGTYYIAIGDWCESEVEITFSVTVA